MQIIAAMLAVVAIALFLCAHFSVPRKWATIPLGLAFLTAAWMVQIIVVTGSHLNID